MKQESEIRILVRGVYAIQKLRIQSGNRIVANFKAKLGQKPSEKESTALTKEELNLLVDLRKSYKRITDGIVGLPTKRKFRGDELISTYTELLLTDQYITLEDSENLHFQKLKGVLEGYAIYTEFLEGVLGVGPAMAGVILSEIDITKCEYPSSLWKYVGVDVAPNGAGRSRKKEHLVKVTYKDKNKNEQERDSITFNPFLKTKLVGVLGSLFIKLGNRSPYRKVYDDYKHRLENHPKHKEKTPLHRHNMANRYMIKRFLVDLYTAWRKLEGLPVADEYSIAKLGMVHRKAS